MNANVTMWLDETYAKMPDRIALVDEYESLTFKQYHDKAIGIADSIIKLGYGPKQPVVVYMNKCVKLLPSFLGIAYAGCFYSPIDVDMPQTRVARILETLTPELVITTADLKEQFDATGYTGKYLIYDEISELTCSDEVSRVASKIIDTDLLYVFFTSGSTGTPKGVCITHRAVMDHVDWVTDTFDITEEDRIGNQAPFYFDLSVQDTYLGIKKGAALYIIPHNLFPQPVRLLEYLRDNKISVFLWVPSAMMLISKLKAFKKVDLSKTLRIAMFCGEVMPNKQLNIWREYLPDVIYANLYGPTETTVASTYYIVERQFSDDESLPIGFAMKNTDILVLDDDNKLVEEQGKTGELCIRGTSVMPGYYRNPEKTSAALVQNPLQDAYEEKIYRTGDVVAYNEYGELLYLSRKDFQIKHLGHRIELGEIETAVSSLEGVTTCCCLYDEKRSRIVLFVDLDMAREELNAKLSGMLPEYMLPGKVEFIETFPYNANGKIDRVKLKEQL